jgi:hypothetical protein
MFFIYTTNSDTLQCCWRLLSDIRFKFAFQDMHCCIKSLRKFKLYHWIRILYLAAFIARRVCLTVVARTLTMPWNIDLDPIIGRDSLLCSEKHSMA